MYNDPAIEVRYFVKGYIQTIEGYIHKVDVHIQLLYLYEETSLSKINLKDIVDIK